MSDKKVLQCKDYPITYTLLIKQVKNINMRIQPTGEIVVSANPFVPQRKIDEFVHQKLSWILENQQKVLKKQSINLTTRDYFVLFGTSLKVKITKGSYNQIHYDADTMYVQLKNEDAFDKTVEQFMVKMCKDVFADIASLMVKKLEDYHLPYPTIKVRKMKSRWGSCIPSKQQITLNQNLIHYPIEFTEYVVLHEFVHFIQPNHSKAFYHIIENYMPDYKERIQLAR